MNRKGNVILVMPYYIHGGAEKQFNYIIDYLRDKGTIVHIILCKKEHACEHTYTDNFLFLEFRLLKEILNYKKRYATNIIIGYDVHYQCLLPILRIFHFQTIFSERNSGHHRLLYSKFAVSSAKVVVTNSKAAMRLLREELGIERICCIENGISIPTKIKRSKNEGFFKVLLPARIHPIKNQLIAIEATSKIQKMELHFAGRIDNSDYYKLLMDRISELSLSNRVFYDGYVENIEKTFNQYDLILLPSRNEGTANVILEAYAFGVPCVMSDIENNKEIAISEHSLFRNGDLDNLIEKLLFFMNISELEREKIILEGYTFVENNYSIKKMCKLWYELVMGF